MTRFVVVVLACILGLAAAAVMDTGRIMRQQTMGLDDDMIVGEKIGYGDGISRMSRLELMRQKFLLDVLLRVQKPLDIPELLERAQTLIVDPSMYIEGIDDEMQYIIELCRSGRLLGIDDIFTIAEEEHVRQMIGMYRLLVRSRDWDTFERNVCYARRNVNGVLLVNALVLAVRDRADTQALIVPALHELLPQLYYDQEVVLRAQTLDLETTRAAMDSDSAMKTMRPGLLDMIDMSRRRKLEGRMGVRVGAGMLDRTQLWMPWREMHMQMAARQIRGDQPLLSTTRMDRRMVLPVEQVDNLIMDDVGLKSYLNGIINELCLRSKDRMNRRNHMRDSMERRGMRDDSIERQDEDISRRPIMMDRNMPRSMMEMTDSEEQLPTRRAEDERLVHIGRRRLMMRDAMRNGGGQETTMLNARERLMRMTSGGHGVRDGRRVMSDMSRRMKATDRRLILEGNEGEREDMLRKRLDHELPTANINDERLLHVGRRHRILSTEMRDDTIGLDSARRRAVPLERQILHLTRGAAIHDGRRTHGPMRMHMARGMENIGDTLINGEDQRQRLWADNDIASRSQHMRGMDRQRGIDMDMNTDNDMKMDRDRGVAMDRRMLRDKMEQRRRIVNGVDDDDDDDSDVRVDDDDEEMMRGPREMVTIGRRRRLPRSLDSMMRSERRSTGELLLHNMRQLLARFNLERMSSGVGSDVGMDAMAMEEPIRRPIDSRLLSEGRAGERYALRLNEMRVDTRRQRLMLEWIAGAERSMLMAIEDELHQRMLGEEEMRLRGSADIDRIIGDVLLGVGIDGVSLLRVMRDIKLQQRDSDGDMNLGGIDMNDPCVRLLMRRIMCGIDKLRDRLLGAYRRDDLLLDGIVINDIAVDRLRTYVDATDADLVNLIDMKQAREIDIRNPLLVARQPRLNHKSFTISVDLNADRAQRVVMRTWLGPAIRGVVDMDELRCNFVLLDTAAVELSAGRNMLQRKSRDLMWTARDTTPFTEIYRRLMSAIAGERIEPLLARDIVGETGRFPHRLLLPRGRANGLPMQLMVVITRADIDDDERDALSSTHIVGMGMNDMSLDRRLPLGFPLDRRIAGELRVPNMRIKDVLVYHDDKMRMAML